MGNVIEHNPDYNAGELRAQVALRDSEGCTLTDGYPRGLYVGESDRVTVEGK